MWKEEKEMSECVTRNELVSLEERIGARINRVEDKVTDICKGQNRMSERIIRIESSTDSFKSSLETFNTRLSEQKDAIIKEITLIFLQEQGTKLFKNKLQLLIGGGLICFLGAIVIAIAGFLSSGIITKIAQVLS